MFIGFVLKQFEYIEVGQFRYEIGKDPLNNEGFQLSYSERVVIRFAGYFCLVRKGEFPSEQCARLFSGSSGNPFRCYRFHVTEEVRK